MRSVISLLVALAVLGSIAYGAREIALDRGWLAGRPNSPRVENFKRALDRHLARITDPSKIACAQVFAGPPIAYPDMQFAWAPSSYRTGAGQGRVAQQQEILARHGYLSARTAAGGAPEYQLTWKGYAASNHGSCLFLAGVEHDVHILSFRKLRTERSMDIYEVVARPLPGSLAPWVKDPGFADAFEGARHQAFLDPTPVTYHLARTPDGFAVISEKGRPGAVNGSEREAQPLEDLDPGQIRAAIEAYLNVGGGTRNPVCLRIREHEGIDEMTHDPAPPGASRTPAALTIYNVLERDARAQREALRAYEMLRRLQAAGLATSETFSATIFQRRAAAGGVRFTLNDKAKALWSPEQSCFLLGTWQVAEMLAVQRFSEAAAKPQFVARASVTVREGAQPVIDGFGHLRRLVEAGVGIRGWMRVAQGRVEVQTLSSHGPDFHPDLAEVRLPIIDAAAAAGEPQTRQTRQVPRTPVMPERRLQGGGSQPRQLKHLRCGRDIIVCDAGDTVVCQGRVIPCN